jgi:RecB family endonuclease NucS
MLIIAGKISARYSGRIEAELSLGDAVLFIREPPEGDGSVVLLDAKSGLQARNWMPAGSLHQITASGYKFTYPPRNEQLEVFIEQVYNKIKVPAEVATTLYKIGAEKEKADLLAGCLELIDEKNNLIFIEREYPTDSGPIDIIAKEADTGRAVVIEVKRRKANGASDLYQLKRYLYRVKKDKLISSLKPRGIIVAPSTTKGLIEDIKSEPDITFARLNYQQIIAHLQDKENNR